MLAIGMQPSEAPRARGCGSGLLGRPRPSAPSPARSPRAAAPAPRARPVSPRAASPHNGARPASTARAPSASALTTSAPRRMPPSTSTSTLPSTASATSGSASIVASAPSSWRPPWFETTTPAAPWSAASVGVLGGERCPSPARAGWSPTTSSSRSSQSTAGSIRENMSAGVPADAWPAAVAKLGTVTSAGITKPVRRSRSRRPSRGTSTVSAIASKPASSACSIRARVTPAVAEYVELEPAAPRRRGRRDLGRRGGGQRGQHHHRPGRRGGARHPRLAVGVSHALERHRRHQQRHRHLRAEHRRRRRGAAHVHQRARAQLPAAVRRDVVVERALVARLRPRSSRRRPGRAGRARSLVVGDVARLDRQSLDCRRRADPDRPPRRGT